ncbi:MAG: hypothetical protein AB7O62_25135, partial [Pirellulales bacterium]
MSKITFCRCALPLALAIAAAGPGARCHAADAPAPVPLKKVVLFTSGVGYFERRGEVEGDALLQLRFNAEDVNDLLMSMVVQDEGGGKIGAVSYASQEPLTRTLQTFRIDLTDEPTLADLLRQVRGERVEVELDKTVQGTILGIELRPQPKAGAPGEFVESDVLNVLTDDGLESISLDKVRRLKLLDPALDADLRKALAVLALSHSNDKRAVTLQFTGQGARPVRVGYVQESPIWKTSYRLVLREDEQPLLQGWAIVENTTEEDWSGIELTLVSGRPISFLMDLYQSLYVRRPVVQPELFAGLVSKLHDQDLAARAEEFRGRQGGGFGGGMGGMGGGGFGGGGGGFGGGGGIFGREEPERSAAPATPLDPGQGVEAAASGGEVGELFQYALESPVTLARQKSALLPIVNQAVESEKLSLFNSQTHEKHPLNALRLKNTTGLHLMQGPITVYDGGNYAGNARILDLQPDTSRLITYALDLDVEVASDWDAQVEELVTVRVSGGQLHADYRLRRTQHWTVKNSGSKTKNMLLERALEADWKLVQPAMAAETTRSLQRFEVLAKPGEPATLHLVDEQVVERVTAIDTLADAETEFFRSQAVVDERVQAACDEIARLMREIARLAGERTKIEECLLAVTGDQQR